MNDSSSDRARVWLYLALMALSLGARFLIEGHWIFSGEMYAEMATNYFHTTRTFHNSLSLIFGLDAGYVPLPQRLIASIGWATGMSARWIPYLYTLSATLLLPLIGGIFVLKPFRSLIPSDVVRFLVSLLAIFALDFETRTFLNFTYIGLFSMAVLAALALDEAGAFPTWSSPLLILGLSKPYMIALLPLALFIAARGKTKRVRIFFGIFGGLLLVQLGVLAANAAQGVMSDGRTVKYGLLQIAAATGIYSLTTLGQFLTGFTSVQGSPTVFLAVLALWGAATMFLAVPWAVKSPDRRYALICAALSLIVGVTAINCVSQQRIWNIHVQLPGVGLVRHVTGVYFGTLLLLAWLANTVATRPSSPIVKYGSRSSHAAVLFALWMMVGGAIDRAFAWASPATFPDIGVSDWQRMAAEIDAKTTPIAVLINPYRWVYGPAGPSAQDFPPLTGKVLDAAAGQEFELPGSSAAAIVAIGVVMGPVDGPSSREITLRFRVESDRGLESVTSTRSMRGPTVVLANFSRVIPGIRRAWVSSDAPVQFLAESSTVPAPIYVTTDRHF